MALDGRSVQRSFLIGFFCCVGLVSTLALSLSYSVQLTFRASALRPSKAQLFLNTGGGFTEAESTRIDLDSHSLDDFQTIKVDLPSRPILDVRFDPADTEGTFALRDFALVISAGSRKSLQVANAAPFHEVASLRQEGATLRLVTTPGATDPGIRFGFSPPVQTRPLIRWQKAWRLLIWNGALTLVFLLIWLFRNRVWDRLESLNRRLRRWNAPAERLAERLSDKNFIHLDALALWVYVVCVLCFAGAVAGNLNSSSSEKLHDMFSRGGTAATLLGEARAIRSDEWGYSTPDVLSQAFRTDRFQVTDSDLGGHSVALLGNLPAKHVTTLVRPQFWGFFLLPAEYGYSFFWQSKALLLVIGVFTWILWLSGSSKWGLMGALWFFFSPETQWSYSWPSGLPEMVGLSCLSAVSFAYLVVGRNRLALWAMGVLAVGSSVDFAMCSYLPQIIPLAWVQIAVLTAWCWGMRKQIAEPHFRTDRLAVIAGTVVAITTFGAILFLSVHQATAAISNTVYPGHRMLSGGTISPWEFVAQLLPWKLTENRFPAVFGNVSEGSGFLWLAPLTLLCLRNVSFSKPRKALFIALWICFLGIAAWLVLPIPERVGALFGLNRTFGGRCIPALGLANVGILGVCLANHRFYASTPWKTWALRAISGLMGTLLFLWIFAVADDHMDHFFSTRDIFWGSVALAVAVTLMIASRHRVLAIALVGSHALFFGAINPVQRGVHVFTQSALFRFVHSDPALTRDRWIIYTDQPTLSGLFAGVGCEIYTGTRYLPDIDHFSLFKQRGLDLEGFNRLGYLLVTLPDEDRQTKLHLINPVIVDWKVSPLDPLLKQIGIRYVAFDAISEPPPPWAARGLIKLADHPVDGFWLYRLP